MTADHTTQARELADQTWSVLRETKMPKALHPVAFASVFSFLASDGPPAAAGDRHGAQDKSNDPQAPEGIPAIAEALGIDEENAGYLFDIDGKDLDLTIARDQLSKDRAAALREVAFLVVAGRQAAGLDPDRTDSGHVRTQGVHLNVMNKNTFREEMGKLGPYITAKNAGRFARSLKMTRGGREEAAKITKRLIDKRNSAGHG